MGNNGSFAIFAAVTQTAVTECEVEKEQEEQEGRSRREVSDRVRVHNVLNSSSSSLSKRNPKRQAIFLFLSDFFTLSRRLL